MAKREGLAWGSGTIVARGDRHQARWQELGDDGTIRRRARTFDTRDQAEDHLTQMRRDKRDGRYTPPSERTVADLIEDWLERGKGRWKPATQAAYRKSADNYVIPTLGHLRAETLTTPRVQHWIDRLTRSGLSASTIDGAAHVLGAAMREAVRIGVLPRDPSAGVRLPAIARPAIVVWRVADVAAVVAALKDEPMWRALYVLALTTGMRPGELRALRWADVDLASGTATVRRTITVDAANVETVGATTKTGQVRAVALAPSAVVALDAWRTAQAARRRLSAEPWPVDAVIFDRGDGRHLPRATWEVRHNRLCEEAGVPRIKLHGLRHSAATLMLEDNAHPKLVQEMLGHKDIATTLNTYSHPSADLHRAAAESLDKRLFGGANTTTEAQQHRN